MVLNPSSSRKLKIGTSGIEGVKLRLLVYYVSCAAASVFSFFLCMEFTQV